ncbi:ABC transporter substrate-binding protein [Microbacterium sp. NPDC077184]|uniref:ABC transporter substrate-binding protein n=1 Tax=Microbacterium sp. NPDC077184 TaxID=3154764 RepID=UPI00344ADEF2
MLSVVSPGRRIEVQHTQPWRGRLVIALKRTGPRATRVRVSEHFDERGLRWMMRARGWPSAEANPSRTHRIGLLTSKSGTVAMFTAGCENLAELAVEQLNLDGGVGNLPFELLVGDDGSAPRQGVSEVRRLARLGCSVIIASVSSATYRAVEAAMAHEDVLLIQPIMNEGGLGANPLSFRLGERPRSQFRRSLQSVPDAARAAWFLVGNSYAWSEGAHRAVREDLRRRRALVRGEHLLPLGAQDFAPVIDKIQQSGADFVLSSLVGHDEVAFQRTLWASGLRHTVTTVSLTADDLTVDHIGRAAAEGVWAVSGYFSGLGCADDGPLQAHNTQRYGPWAPAITTYSESTYTAIQVYARALAAAGRDASRREIATALSSIAYRAPRGAIRVDGRQHLHGPLHVVQARQGTWRSA